MQPAESVAAFESAVTAAGATVGTLDAATALAHMAAFYRNERAENCRMDDDGDILLCHWGPFEQGAEKTFQLEFARHFIEPGDEDEDGMSQLSLTLNYAPEAELLKLGEGTCQCSSPADLVEFEKKVLASAPYRAVCALRPQETTLDWGLL